MKTETPSAPAAPGNQTTRQLAATLIKTTPAPGDQAKTEPGASAPTEPAEPEPIHEPAPEPTEPESLTTVEEGEPTPDAETEPATDPEPNPEADPAPELPAEVLEAIEIAKAQDGGKGKAEMLKRIHKLTDARDTERNARLQAEESTKNLRLELQQAREAKPQAQTPAGMHPAVHAVTQELANVDHWLGWCEDNLAKLQSGEVETVEAPDGQGGKIQVGLKDVAKTKRDLENIRQETVAKKVQTERDVQTAFQQAYRENHQKALTVYPWLENKTAPEYQQFQEVLKVMPGFKQIPDHELAIGDFLTGKALREAKAAGKQPAAIKKAAPSREPTKVTTTPPGGGSDPTPEPEKKVKASTQQFAKTGSMRDLAKTLTASRQASRAVKR